jgi:hypothetical protein
MLPKAKVYSAFGKDLTIKEWLSQPECEHENYSTLKDRFQKYAPEEALTGGYIELYEYNGLKKKWSYWRKNPPVEAINWRTIRTRMDAQGMSFREAIDLPKRQQIALETIDGETKHRMDWVKSDKCVVGQGLVWKRLADGWSFKDAILTPAENGSSLGEQSLAAFIEALGLEFDIGNRNIIPPYELDIFIPSKNIAIEFNGLYWHSEEKRGSRYHYNKWNACNDRGIQLIQIWEDDWKYRRYIVERMIANKLGCSMEPRVYARNCHVTVEDKNTAQEFLEGSHIQGFVLASYHYGLRDMDGDLLAICSFKKDGEYWDLVRYATSKKVIGGFSKVLKKFRLDHSGPIKTFADLTISNGDLYYKTGFVLDKILDPDYSYVMSGMEVRQHKFSFRKKRFKDDPNLSFSEHMTERELAAKNNLYRVYDAGKLRFILE